MAREKTGPETQALRNLVDSLPKQIVEWTPEQREQYNTQSNIAMRERNGIQQPELS
jgi:hypothetical protein